jgi:hypothetical protein
MALILAIEPDRRQASKVAAIAKNRLHAEIVQADTTEHAIEALGGRVPDLILTSLLLSRKDDAALADWLRESDEAGKHVQTLVIPVLGSSRDGEDGGGLLSRLTRGKSRDDATTDGCEPEVFAAQIREYLESAAQERRNDLEDAEAAEVAAARGGLVDTDSPAPAAATYRNEHAASVPVRSWDDPYQDGNGNQQAASFEIEAVAPGPMDDAASVAADEGSADDNDAWSEIPLVEHADRVDASAIGGNYSLDEDEGGPLELDSEPIDLQRFVEELANDRADQEPASRSSDNVLAEFQEALEVIEPNRPNGHSEADSDVLTPLVASTAWPQLESTVAKPPPGAEPSDAAAAAARPRPRKKSKAVAPQTEWNLFDPEQCGFSDLLAKLDQMAD